ncbi:MAG: alpha/beta hydrolase [Actinobacteria bacterium]|nr:alpha/beta hydrolase [Actinomycetota bacterium]
MSAGLRAELTQSLRMIAYSTLASSRYYHWMLRERPERAKGRVDIGDARIFYLSCGRGEPLLLLHGGFAYAETWVGQTPELAQRYRVIAPDSRGHGRSTLGTKPITYRQMAEDMAALVERLGLGGVHLIGWSDGGCTSLAMALQRPDLVRSMVLLGTPFNTDNYSAEGWRQMESILDPRSLSMLSLRSMRRMMNPEPHRGKEFLEEMSRMWRTLPDFTTEDLGRIEAPTLVIGCDRDEFLSLWPDPLQVFKDTTAAIPNARLEIVRGGTHFVSLERAREVNRLILDFLASL